MMILDNKYIDALRAFKVFVSDFDYYEVKTGRVQIYEYSQYLNVIDCLLHEIDENMTQSHASKVYAIVHDALSAIAMHVDNRDLQTSLDDLLNQYDY